MGLGPAELSFTCLEPQKVPAAKYPRWAVLGRSNVGKSSFLNSLIHPNSLFRTGRTPGVTTGLIGVQVKLGKSEDSILELVDLPGFGFALPSASAGQRWGELAQRLREISVDRGLLWVWLADPQRAPAGEESELIRWMGAETYSFVFTKADQVKMSQREGILKAWKPYIETATEGPYWVSSLKGDGMNEIFKSARNFVRGHAMVKGGSPGNSDGDPK